MNATEEFELLRARQDAQEVRRGIVFVIFAEQAVEAFLAREWNIGNRR